MTTTEVFAIGSFALITILFAVVRSRMILFPILCVAILAVFSFGTWDRNEWRSGGEFLLGSAGLTLYAFGLLIVRVMLTRSVSLKLLGSYAARASETVQEGIANRLKDLGRYRLVRTDGESFALSAFGRGVSGLVKLCYLLLKVR